MSWPLGWDGHLIMPRCSVCSRPKSPPGRDVPGEAVSSFCNRDCAGYVLSPEPSSYWRVGEEPLPGTAEALNLDAYLQAQRDAK